MNAKDILIAPITREEAAACMRHWHYSKRVYGKSVLHVGVLIGDVIVGAMSWGPGVDTRNSIGIIPGTAWDGYLELNRMAFSEAAPRFSESRALAICIRAIAKHAPHVEWLVSFADGAQSGRGTIYKASGWTLTQCRKNTTLWRDVETDAVVSDVGIRTSTRMRLRYGCSPKSSPLLTPLEGYMRRYHFGLSKRAKALIAELACADTEMVSAEGPPRRAFDSTCPLSIPTQCGDRPTLAQAISALPRYADPEGATSKAARAKRAASRAVSDMWGGS